MRSAQGGMDAKDGAGDPGGFQLVRLVATQTATAAGVSDCVAHLRWPMADADAFLAIITHRRVMSRKAIALQVQHSGGLTADGRVDGYHANEILWKASRLICADWRRVGVSVALREDSLPLRGTEDHWASACCEKRQRVVEGASPGLIEAGAIKFGDGRSSQWCRAGATVWAAAGLRWTAQRDDGRSNA